MQNTVLKLDTKDNVLIALRDLRKGERISFGGRDYLLDSDVPAKHKFATQPLPIGSSLVMYGVLVGKARELINRGEIITTRNTGHEAAPYRASSRYLEWLGL